MFYWLIEHSNTVPSFARFITFRSGGAMVTGALFVFLFGPWIIDHLHQGVGRIRRGSKLEDNKCEC